jgi:cytochrome c-type biogenesis protein CcmH
LNELDLEERDRNMDRDTAVDERRRLETELVDVLKRLQSLASDVGAVNAQRERSTRRWRVGIVALAIAVPTLAAGLYMIDATVSPTRLAQAAAQAPRGMPLDPRQMVARLEARLQENPNDFAGWVRLGRSYSVLARFPDSKRAYARAYALMPPDYQPESPDALLFLGFAANDAGNTQRAIQYWSALLTQMPPDSPIARELKRVIDDAKRKSPKKK